MKRCPACRTEYANEARFCTRDGSRLLESTPVSRTPPERAPAGHAEGAGEPPLAGYTLQGRYRVERKIGEGGMSVVYLANDVVARQPCAIKVLSAELSHDARAMARLRREASLGMRLAHPNVCHIIRLGETEDGLTYIVMPLLEGELLADRTTRLGHLELEETVLLVRDVAAGLQAAHELKIVHRDLKPENIMVCTRRDGSEYAVVLDFGLAKERRAGPELQKLTATGIVVGTPEFMSPEQLRGKPLDARSDVYSLALVTYEMLTGRLPFPGRTQQELMMARLRGEPIPLRRRNSDMTFPEAVEQVLTKGLARTPNDRYETAREFAEALGRAAAHATPGERVSP